MCVLFLPKCVSLGNCQFLKSKIRRDHSKEINIFVVAIVEIIGNAERLGKNLAVLQIKVAKIYFGKASDFYL